MTSFKSVATGLVLLAMVGTGHAQLVSKSSLTLGAAKQIIAAAAAEAKTKNAPGGVIAVVDDGGNLIALERLDNTFVAGANISIGKARTAAMFKRPTRFFEDIIKNGRTAMVALPDFTPLQGGIPIMVDGQVIGGIGVSGAASAQQDEEIATAGAAAVKFLKAEAAGSQRPSAVTYIDSKMVAAGFVKGAVLVNNDNYMVHASHREAEGMAEVHVLDTDIIYVLEGAATFITGGTVVDGKTTEPFEIRGAFIQGGDSRRIGKGDVIIVPNEVPHMFHDVQGPLNYYVVKVR